MTGAETALSAMPRDREVTLLIGPEGGWSEREVAMVSAHAGLGPRNLRADTAAIVAAHRLAMRSGQRRARLLLAQSPLVLLMVAYTMAGLWVLAHLLNVNS